MSLTDPIPSRAFDVHDENMRNNDKFVNSTDLSFTNRPAPNGQATTKTLAGMNKDFDDQSAEFQVDIDAFKVESSAALGALGGVHVGEYSTDPLITERNQYVTFGVSPNATQWKITDSTSLDYQIDSTTFPDPEDDPSLIMYNDLTKQALAGYTQLAFKVISDVDLGLTVLGSITPKLGDRITVEDYATGNGSGILFFRIVAAATGIDDGGKYIDLPTLGLQLEQNLAKPYNTKAWGLVADHIPGTGASTDNSPMIQATIDHSAATGFIPVYQPSGICRIDTALAIDNNIDFFGDDSRSVLEYFDTEGITICADAPYASEVKIRNMKLVRRGVTGTCITSAKNTVQDAATFIQNLTIDGVRFESSEFIMVISQSRNVKIKNCTGIHNDSGIILDGQVVLCHITDNDIQAGLGAGIEGVRVQGNTDFLDVQFRQPESVQINNHNRIIGYAKGVRVLNLLYGCVSDNDLDGIAVTGVEVDQATDLTISGNWVAILGGNPTTSHGVMLTSGPNYAPAYNGVNVIDNKIRSTDNSAFAAVYIGSFREAINVTLTYADGGVTNGIYAEGTANDLSLTSNKLDGVSNRGIQLQPGCDDVNISGNRALTMGVTGTTNVVFGKNNGMFTEGLLKCSIPANLLVGTVSVPATIPLGASIHATGMSDANIDRGTIDVFWDGGTIITVTVENTFASTRDVTLYVRTFT